SKLACFFDVLDLYLRNLNPPTSCNLKQTKHDEPPTLHKWRGLQPGIRFVEAIHRRRRDGLPPAGSSVGGNVLMYPARSADGGAAAFALNLERLSLRANPSSGTDEVEARIQLIHEGKEVQYGRANG